MRCHLVNFTFLAIFWWSFGNPVKPLLVATVRFYLPKKPWHYEEDKILVNIVVTPYSHLNNKYFKVFYHCQLETKLALYICIDCGIIKLIQMQYETLPQHAFSILTLAGWIQEDHNYGPFVVICLPAYLRKRKEQIWQITMMTVVVISNYWQRGLYSV